MADKIATESKEEDQETSTEEEAAYDEAFKSSGVPEKPEGEEEEPEQEQKPDEGEEEEPEQKAGKGAPKEKDEQAQAKDSPPLTKREIAEQAGNKIIEGHLTAGKTPPEDTADRRAEAKKPAADKTAQKMPWDYSEEEAEWIKDFPEVEKVSDKRAVRLLAKLIEQGKIITPYHIEQVNQQLVDLDAKLSLTSFENAMYRKMPDWMEVASTKEFEDWKGKQPPGIKALADSANPEDALKLIDYYKEDVAKSKTADFDRKKTERADKTDKVLSHISHRGGGARGKAEADTNDFDAAWEEAKRVRS